VLHAAPGVAWGGTSCVTLRFFSGLRAGDCGGSSLFGMTLPSFSSLFTSLESLEDDGGLGIFTASSCLLAKTLSCLRPP